MHKSEKESVAYGLGEVELEEEGVVEARHGLAAAR